MIGPPLTRAAKVPAAEQVASDKTNDGEEFDRLTGDGLRIKKSANKDSLWIKGDGCRVTFATNSGKLRITGDGCRVHIGCNLGSVEYTGDGGHIVLGPESESAPDRIVYRGDGGLIDFAGNKRRVVRSRRTNNNEMANSCSNGMTSRADTWTKVVGSSNVQIHFNLRVHDKSS